jgi:hypothetical protein
VQLIGGKAALVKIARGGTRSSAPASPVLEQAVLLTTEPAKGLDVEMLVPAGTFTSMEQIEMLLGDKSYRLKPTKVVERSARSERVALNIADAS